MAMIFQHRVFWLPKDVQDPQGYEDAFQVDESRGLAAVCDGVSSTLFSRRWADLLAQQVIGDPPNVADAGALDAWLKRAREAWSGAIDEKSLAWHQKAKLLEGAGSTLLWVQVRRPTADDGLPRPLDLLAFAIGDCCLFHVRGTQVLQTFPIQDSSRFENHPQVLRSVYKRADLVAFEAMESQCHPGDLLALCTDAVATWIMRQLEGGAAIDWQRFWRMPLAEWQNWMVQLRQASQIRFDDSTLVLLQLDETLPRINPIEGKSDARIQDVAGEKIRDAMKSIKGSLRRSLRGLSDSRWLDDSDPR